ncbi:MAG: MASE3 domain-containing protein, partial [Desulfurivibrionaceae bacterium]
MVYAQGLARESGLGLNRGKLFLIIMVWVVVFAALLAIARHNYLLFHSSAEIFSIIIASGMFILVWNTRGQLDNNFLFFLGLSYLFVGGLDGLH